MYIGVNANINAMMIIIKIVLMIMHQDVTTPLPENNLSVFRFEDIADQCRVSTTYDDLLLFYSTMRMMTMMMMMTMMIKMTMMMIIITDQLRMI